MNPSIFTNRKMFTLVNKSHCIFDILLNIFKITEGQEKIPLDLLG